MRTTGRTRRSAACRSRVLGAEHALVRGRRALQRGARRHTVVGTWLVGPVTRGAPFPAVRGADDGVARSMFARAFGRRRERGGGRVLTGVAADKPSDD